MRLLLAVSGTVPAAIGIWLITRCRFVVTGPEDGYHTCDGPGGGLTEGYLFIGGMIFFAVSAFFFLLLFLVMIRDAASSPEDSPGGQRTAETPADASHTSSSKGGVLT